MPIKKSAQPSGKTTDAALLPHENLLRACAATWVDDATRHAVDTALSARDIAWPAFVQQSIRHGLSPLVALHLQVFADDPRLPTDVAVCFARMYRANASRNHVLFREAARLARALEAAHIPCLVLKGVALALTVYSDPALRNFADIDILVAPENFAAASEVAATCDFVREIPEPRPKQHHVLHAAFCAEDILTETLAPEFDPTFTPDLLARYRHQIVLEIHRGLFRLPNGCLREVDMAPFWERAQTVAFADGTPMRLPSPEAMLVHLAAHAADHIFRRLLFPVDIVAALRYYKGKIDWNRIITLADRYQVRADVYRMLEFAQREFQADVPTMVLHNLLPDSGALPGGQRLNLVAVFQAMQADESAQSWRLLQRATGAREFLASCGATLFPPLSILRRIYGEHSLPFLLLLYLFRPFHLTARLARVLYRQALPQSRALLPKGEREHQALLPKGIKNS